MTKSKWMTDDTLLAAAIQVVTGETPQITSNPHSRFLRLQFADTQLLRDTITAYNCGMELEAKGLLLAYRGLITRLRRERDGGIFSAVEGGRRHER